MKQQAARIFGILFKQVLPLVVGLVVLTLVIAWISGMFIEKIPPGETTAHARLLNGRPTDTVHEIIKHTTTEALGTLKAASRTEISSKVLATIKEIKVSAGDEVVTGDLLVLLDSSELEAKLKQAEQMLIAANARLKKANGDYNRDVKLRERNVKLVSEEQFQRSLANKTTAQADVIAAEQAVVAAKVRLGYTKILAPKKGRVIDRLAEPGDNARPGEPLLVLYDDQSLRLEAPVVEKLAIRMKRGQNVMVWIDSLNKKLVGTVDEIVPEAESRSRSLLVKVTIPPTEGLFEGMFGRLMIPSGKREFLCLPTAAIQRIGQLQFVDVVSNPETKVLERRMIQTGRLGLEGRIEVLSGVSANEEVVLYGVGDQPTAKNISKEGENQ